MASVAQWVQTERRLPEDGVEVETVDSGGNVQNLVRDGGLWFFPDRSMYVYYTPRAWRSL